MTEAVNPSWIAVDWGTSNVRAFAVAADGSVLAEAKSDEGMGKLVQAEFEPALLRLVGAWLGDDPITVVACGMVGARQGWAEASYLTVPCKAQGADLTCPAVNDPRLQVHILPGVCQNEPADVMRGEETQILGVLADDPAFDGVLCLPGTHTKWAHISAEEIVSFQTVMTGELFALISGQSVLRHSVKTKDFDLDAFDAAVSDTLSNPERLAQRLFRIRAEGLLHGQSDAVSRGRLSGLLIGAELAACRPYWLGQNVIIGGDAKITSLYARGLKAQGLSVQERDGDDLTLGGLRLAYQSLTETV